MAAATPASITFVLAGTRRRRNVRPRCAALLRLRCRPGFPAGRIKQSVRVGAQRGGASDIRMTAVSGEDVVVLHLVGGPLLRVAPGERA